MLTFTLWFVLLKVGTSIDLNAKAFQSISGIPQASDFPETSLLANKPSTAIAFTGGGSRSYIASMGYLAGLHELDLIKNARYIGGMSGGSWATMTYTYAQNIDDDSEFLGSITSPEEISMSDLKQMNPKCARSFAKNDMTIDALQAVRDGVVETVAEGWVYGMTKAYYEPIGVTANTRFSWSQQVVDDIKARNPSLQQETFLLPANSERPFPLIAFVLVGPVEGAPYKDPAQNFTQIDMTPLYVGQMKTLNVNYDYAKGLVHSKRIGGLLENFAFGRVGAGSATAGLGPFQSSGELAVPEPSIPLDIPFAAGSSGYAPGTIFASLSPDQLALKLSMEFDYWSPAELRPEQNTMLVADGGLVENIPLISFMQREVRKIALFINSDDPLQPTSVYNATSDTFSGEFLEACLAAFFGVMDPTASKGSNRTVEHENDQVFRTEDWPMVVDTLQAKQAEGGGIIASFNLTTVQNDWWGIPANRVFDVTFIYLGRLTQWESRLNEMMQKLVVPHDPVDAANPGQLIDHGPFKHFPHYITAGGLMDYERANLLADLTGWSVLNNADTFHRIFS